MLKLSQNRFYSVPVVMRTLDVIEYLHKCDSPLKTNEISDILRVPRSTMYRILRTLVHRGYVFQDLDGRFSFNHSDLKFALNRSDGEVCASCQVRKYEATLPDDEIIEMIFVLLRGLIRSNRASLSSDITTLARELVSSDVHN